MKIRVLGCDGGELKGYFPVAFLINDHLLFEAGSVTSKLSLQEQLKIKEIIISHSHLDHIKDLCFLADNLFLSGAGHPTIPIYSSEAILTDLKKNIFNGIIWPDVTKIPSLEHPLYQLRSIKSTLTLSELKVEAIAVTHSHAALGYIISDKKGAIVFSGDTGPTEELWEKVNTLKNLKALFLEVSFPSGLADIAWASRHLSVETVIREIKKIKHHPTVPIYLYHLKPVYAQK